MKIAQKLSGLLCILLAHSALAFAQDPCAGAPGDAVMKLPAPLSEWGRVTCTPYGHVIEANEGWVWTTPGGYFPQFIPAQMVRSNPELLGNRAYFTRIEFLPASGPEAEAAYKAFMANFDAEEVRSSIYRLDVTSASGKSLHLYFFESVQSRWGIWCKKSCQPESAFMLLNVGNAPNNSLQGRRP